MADKHIPFGTHPAPAMSNAQKVGGVLDELQEWVMKERIELVPLTPDFDAKYTTLKAVGAKIRALRAAPTPDAHSEVGDDQTRILIHQLRRSAEIQDTETKAKTGWADTSDRAELMRKAANHLTALTAGVANGNLADVISDKMREIAPLMPTVTYRSGGIYVAEVARLTAKAKEQQSAVVGGPDGDSILGYTIPTGTWLMLQANIAALIDALSAREAN